MIICNLCKNKHHPHHAVTYTQVLVKDGSLIVKAKELAENVEVDLSKLQSSTPLQSQSLSPFLVKLLVGEYIRGHI